MKPIALVEEIAPHPVDLRLSEADIARAKRIRWQWTLTYNRIKNAPWNSATDTHLARCDEVIAIIDSMLAANVRIH